MSHTNSQPLRLPHRFFRWFCQLESCFLGFEFEIFSFYPSPKGSQEIFIHECATNMKS